MYLKCEFPLSLPFPLFHATLCLTEISLMQLFILLKQFALKKRIASAKHLGHKTSNDKTKQTLWKKAKQGQKTKLQYNQIVQGSMKDTAM